MSDFSLFSLFTAGLACMVPFASAYTHPTGSGPVGNPIYQPGLNSLVPAGQGFIITWKPTTEGNITLLLLKGPSSNVVPIGIIAENVANNGAYNWIPSVDIQPSPNGEASGYGIQLIDDATGQYQYSTQFGISNPKWQAGETWGNLGSQIASKTASPTGTATGMSTVTSTPSGYSTKGNSTVTSTHSKHNGNNTATATKHSTTKHSSSWTSSTLQPSTALVPSATYSSTYSTATPTVSPTNGAATSAASFVGLVIAAAVAVFTL